MVTFRMFTEQQDDEFRQAEKEFEGSLENDILELRPGENPDGDLAWYIFEKNKKAFVGYVWITPYGNLARDRFTAYIFSSLEHWDNDPLEAATLAWKLALRDLTQDEIALEMRDFYVKYRMRLPFWAKSP